MNDIESSWSSFSFMKRELELNSKTVTWHRGQIIEKTQCGVAAVYKILQVITFVYISFCTPVVSFLQI